MIITENINKQEQFRNCSDLFAKIILGKLNSNDITCWVAGGALKDYFSGKRRKFSDIDVYFPNTESYNEAVILLQELTETDGHTVYNNVYIEESQQILPDTESPRFTTFKYNGNYVQLIAFKFFDNPEQTIDNFDFTCCSCAIDLNNIYYHETFFIDLASKKLAINKLPYPLSTLRRLQKYIQNGFTICSGGLYDLAQAINELQDDEINEQNIVWYID